MYNAKRCHVLGRGDLVPSARNLPLDKLRMKHVLAASMSNQAKEAAQLVIVKLSNVEKAVLKDVFEDVVE